jgi:fatty-acyl-CoA synthase
MSMDLPYLIRRARSWHPEAPAVADRSRTRTLAELVDRAERFANALDAIGVAPGAAVAVLSENRLEYPEVDLGLALGRRVRVALNARLHVEDLRHMVADSGAEAIVHSAAFSDAAAVLGVRAIDLDDGYEAMLTDPAPVVRPGDDEDPAWITYTSGSTGLPKGVELSHRSIREVALNLLLETGPLEAGSRVVLTQPLSHGAGYFVLPYLLAGGGVYVMDRFDPEEILHAAALPGVETLKLVPAMLPPLLAVCPGPLPYDTLMYGASPVPGPVLTEALERWGPVLVQIYGQSEAPVTLTCLHKADHVGGGDQVLSAGRAWRSVAVEVRRPDGTVADADEIGEVTVRGSHAMTRYRNLPDATREVMRDGWIWTKDVGRQDERGFVHLLGRRDEIINSGGFNIAPREVERVLQEHPQVTECVVMGMPDERWGSAVHAVVCLAPGVELTGTALLASVRDRLGFRTPKRVVLAPEIPRTPYGKPDRARIRELLS